jgi:hypothetical protein
MRSTIVGLSEWEPVAILVNSTGRSEIRTTTKAGSPALRQPQNADLLSVPESRNVIYNKLSSESNRLAFAKPVAGTFLLTGQAASQRPSLLITL